MNFEFKESIHHPIEKVYPIMRDELSTIIELIPNVDAIRVLERERREDGRLLLVNEWHGAPTSTPAPIRPFIKPDLLIWRDIALWDDAKSLIEWRFETPSFSNLYSCSGTNYIEKVDEKHTVVRLTGTLELYPENIPGLNRFLAKKLAPTIEKWLMALVSPNLAEVPRAVETYLDQNA